MHPNVGCWVTAVPGWLHMGLASYSALGKEESMGPLAVGRLLGVMASGRCEFTHCRSLQGQMTKASAIHMHAPGACDTSTERVCSKPVQLQAMETTSHDITL